MTTVGQRIRQARERLGMSQEELAALVSRDQAAISEYENGKRKIAVTELPSFARILRVPLLYFFEEELTPDDFDQALLSEFRRLPDVSKPGAIQMMRVLVNITNTLTG